MRTIMQGTEKIILATMNTKFERSLAHMHCVLVSSLQNQAGPIEIIPERSRL